MEPEPIKKRLDALDGLRGIAILLVLLSHLTLTVLFDKGSNLVLKTIFDSGEIGVSILFILSGFLMAYLYPNPKSKLGFLQKRYTRIFPAFIAVCLLLTVSSLNTRLIFYPIPSILWLFGIAIFCHIMWVYVIKLLPPRFSKLLFYSFLLAQIAVGAFYLLWVMRMDYVLYIETIPESIRALITFLVNATLTLPLGTYSGPLSSVYWSLGTEVYFYILYPLIAVPFISLASKTSKTTKLILLFSTLPLFIGLYLISQKFLFFKLLHLELAYYFVGGLTLGYLYRTRTFNFDQKTKTILSYASLPLFIGTIMVHQAALMYFPPDFSPYIKTFFTIPLTLSILPILFEHTISSKFFNSKLLISIGTISYSMYLIHMFIYDVIKKQLGDPFGPIEIMSYILISITAAIVVAIGMYYLLERPYFKRRKSNELTVKKVEEQKSKYTITKLVIGISIVYFITTFFGYNSEFKLFSLQSRHTLNNIVTTQQIDQIANLNINPITLQFKATENNLAIIQLDVSNTNLPNVEFKKQEVIAKLKEAGTTDWQETKIIITSRDDTFKNLFGFTPIPDSAGKTFDLELKVSAPDSSYQIIVNTKHEVLIAHYTLNKSAITNPETVLKLAANKTISILENQYAQTIFLLYLPFLCICIYLIKKAKR